MRKINKIMVLFFLFQFTGLFISSHIVFPSTGFISGNVYEIDSKTPVIGAIVTAVNNTTSEFYIAKTTESGFYSLKGLKAGVYHLEAQARNYNISMKTNVSVSPSKSTAPIDFILIEYGKIAGNVKDNQTKLPIEGAIVSAVDQHDNHYYSQTDADGKYEIKLLPTVYCNIKVKMDGYSSKIVENISINSEIDLELDKEAILSGTVSEEQTDFKISDTLIIVMDNNNSAITAQSSSDGTYIVTGLAAGQYVIFIKAQDEYEVAASDIIDLDAGDDLTIDFHLIRK